jgi:hypothetical protein
VFAFVFCLRHSSTGLRTNIDALLRASAQAEQEELVVNRGQVLFFESDEVCETSYKDRGGKYQGQQGVTLPKI